MKKIINEKVLVIPPYISTSWKNINAIYQKGNSLILTLVDSTQVTIPEMEIEDIERVFSIHADFLEKEAQNLTSISTAGHLPLNSFTNLISKETPLNVGFGGLDNIGFAIQHNPALSKSPDLPSEIIKKITQISKVVSHEDITQLPKAEQNCNCTYCQIARALQGSLHESNLQDEIEEISDSDLNFQNWTIEQTGENLFTLTNRLDKDEQYSVYLGEPVGCTCGKTGCEHIVAVLKS